MLTNQDDNTTSNGKVTSSVTVDTDGTLSYQINKPNGVIIVHQGKTSEASSKVSGTEKYFSIQRLLNLRDIIFDEQNIPQKDIVFDNIKPYLFNDFDFVIPPLGNGPEKVQCKLKKIFIEFTPGRRDSFSLKIYNINKKGKTLNLLLSYENEPSGEISFENLVPLFLDAYWTDRDVHCRGLNLDFEHSDKHSVPDMYPITKEEDLEKYYAKAIYDYQYFIIQAPTLKLFFKNGKGFEEVKITDPAAFKQQLNISPLYKSSVPTNQRYKLNENDLFQLLIKNCTSHKPDLLAAFLCYRNRTSSSKKPTYFFEKETLQLYFIDSAGKYKRLKADMLDLDVLNVLFSQQPKEYSEKCNRLYSIQCVISQSNPSEKNRLDTELKFSVTTVPKIKKLITDLILGKEVPEKEMNEILSSFHAEAKEKAEINKQKDDRTCREIYEKLTSQICASQVQSTMYFPAKKTLDPSAQKEKSETKEFN